MIGAGWETWLGPDLAPGTLTFSPLWQVGNLRLLGFIFGEPMNKKVVSGKTMSCRLWLSTEAYTEKIQIAEWQEYLKRHIMVMGLEYGDSYAAPAQEQLIFLLPPLIFCPLLRYQLHSCLSSYPD